MCGTSGAGKTQLSLQACLTVQLSEERGGVAGRAIYLDTEGCFSTRRLIHLAEAHLNLLTQSSTPLTAAPTSSSLAVPFREKQSPNVLMSLGSPQLVSTSASANARIGNLLHTCNTSPCCHFGYSLPPNLCGRDSPPGPQPQLIPSASPSVGLDVEPLAKRICLSPLATLENLSSSDTQAHFQSSKSACPADDVKIPQQPLDLENTLEAKPDKTETEPNIHLSPLPPSFRALFDNVDCVRVRDAAQLVRALDCVEAELERSGDCQATVAMASASAARKRPPLKLLVVDSVAAVLRNSCLEQPAALEQWQSALGSTRATADKRTHYMNTIAVQLSRIAKKHEVAVLVVNQLTSYEQQQQAEQADLLCGAEPALGESWSHVCSLRMALARDPSTAAPGVRVACLLKDYARAARSKVVRFQLASEGVRDLPI